MCYAPEFRKYFTWVFTNLLYLHASENYKTTRIQIHSKAAGENVDTKRQNSKEVENFANKVLPLFLPEIN